MPKPKLFGILKLQLCIERREYNLYLGATSVTFSNNSIAAAGCCECGQQKIWYLCLFTITLSILT